MTVLPVLWGGQRGQPLEFACDITEVCECREVVGLSGHSLHTRVRRLPTSPIPFTDFNVTPIRDILTVQRGCSWLNGYRPFYPVPFLPNTPRTACHPCRPVSECRGQAGGRTLSWPHS